MSEASSGPQSSHSETTQWILREPSCPLKATVVIVHGLNLRPSRMNVIAHALNEAGCDVLRVTLTGHNGAKVEFKNVSREIWLSDLSRAIETAKAHALKTETPLFFVGYSIGSLLFNDLINRDPDCPHNFEKMILFSPALAVRWYTHFLQALTFAQFIVVPSASPKDYRANPGTPIAAYSALNNSLNALHKTSMSQSDIPTLVFMHKRDELVSYSGIQKLIKVKNLSRWRIIAVENKESVSRPKFHHLTLDSDVLGKDQWKNVMTAMLEHFSL